MKSDFFVLLLVIFLGSYHPHPHYIAMVGRSGGGESTERGAGLLHFD